MIALSNSLSAGGLDVPEIRPPSALWEPNKAKDKTSDLGTEGSVGSDNSTETGGSS